MTNSDQLTATFHIDQHGIPVLEIDPAQSRVFIRVRNYPAAELKLATISVPDLCALFRRAQRNVTGQAKDGPITIR